MPEYYDPPPKSSSGESSPGVSSPEEMFDPAEFDSEDEPEDTFHFSLTELSVLIRVLKTVSIEDLKDFEEPSKFIEQQTKNLLLGAFNQFDEHFGHFLKNLNDFINHHLHIYTKEYSKTVEENERLILNKLIVIRSAMPLEDYATFLNKSGIMPLPENVTFDELKNNSEHLEFYAYNDQVIEYLLRQIDGQEVSIRGYMENYEIFEVKANKFRKIFNQMNPIKPLMKLKDAENSGIILNSEIAPVLSIEYHRAMEDFWPIIYKNYKADIAHWTGKECYNLFSRTLDPNTKVPTYPFYSFFYYVDDLSKDMLDHLILNELAGQIILRKEYLDEDIVEFIPVQKPDQMPDEVPPHFHGELTGNVYIRCRTRFQEIVRAHQQTHAPGERRGRRTRGNRGGRNGGGHE
uniref:Uncharacterized protein n=1 Tax=Meloidogyne floridensis TaxID=298350 RepID=A0A915NIW6_9BILA